MTDGTVTALVAEQPTGVRKIGGGRWEFDLEYPIEHDGEEIKMVTLRRATLGDIEEISRFAEDEEGASSVMVFIAARLLDLSEDEARTIDAEDWGRIQEVITPLMEKLSRGKQT